MTPTRAARSTWPPTGLRSGKNSYYRDVMRRNERLQRAVTALEGFANGSAQDGSGPDPVVRGALQAATEAVDGRWAALVPVPDTPVAGTDSTIAVDAEGATLQLTPTQVDALARLADSTAEGVVVPLLVDGATVANLCVLGPKEVQPSDISVLRILAGQLANALLALDRGNRLRMATQRQLLESERARIARDLHDSVAQTVLSLGMELEVARGAVTDALGDRHDLTVRVLRAKAQAGAALDELRRSIFMLGRVYDTAPAALPNLLSEVVEHHRPLLDVRFGVEGEAVPLPVATTDSLAMVAGEALFNVVRHAQASAAQVRLRYLTGGVHLVIADDGVGSARALRAALERSRALPGDGRHRGLANMEARATELDGTLSFRRSPLGGVAVHLRFQTTTESAS